MLAVGGWALLLPHTYALNGAFRQRGSATSAPRAEVGASLFFPLAFSASTLECPIIDSFGSQLFATFIFEKVLPSETQTYPHRRFLASAD